jgi:hypothetical protein
MCFGDPAAVHSHQKEATWEKAEWTKELSAWSAHYGRAKTRLRETLREFARKFKEFTKRIGPQNLRADHLSPQQLLESRFVS